jgi:hypothetical protein
LREEIVPGHFVIPDQIIDRTKGIREETFFRGEGLVVHSMFGNPFSDKLNAFVAPRVEEILKTAEGSPKLHTGKTVVCMEGESVAARRALVISRPHTNMQDPPSPQGQNPRCTGNGAETSSTCLSSPRPNSPERPSSSASDSLFSVN